MSVNAGRLDHDIVIKLRNAAPKPPEVDQSAVPSKKPRAADRRCCPPRGRESHPPRTERRACRAAEQAARREQEAAAQRELEEVARRIKDEAARRDLKEAARQRVQADHDADISTGAESTPAPATVVELSHRGSIEVATHELTDWIIEAMNQGATALYLRAGKAPFARIDGQVELLALEPIPFSMFERASAMMSAGEDDWHPAGEWG